MRVQPGLFDQKVIDLRQWQELDGLYSGLPHMEAIPGSGLARTIGILPYNEDALTHMAPLWWVENELFVAVDDPDLPESLKTSQKSLSYNITWLLCSEQQLRGLRLHSRQTLDVARKIDEEQIAILLESKGLISQEQLDSAVTLKKMIRTPLYQTLTRDNPELAETWLDTAAEIQNMTAVHKIDLPSDFSSRLPELFRLVPFELCSRLSILPLNSADGTLVVGMVSRNQDGIHAVEAVSGMKAEARLMDEDLIYSYLMEYSKSFRRPYYLGLDSENFIKFLTASGLLHSSQIDTRELKPDSSISQTADYLVEKDLLSKQDLCQVYGVLCRMPSLSLKEFEPEEALIRKYSPEKLNDSQLLPLFETEDTLWLGIGNPFMNEEICRFEKMSGKKIIPVFVPENNLVSILYQQVQNETQSEKEKRALELINALVDKKVLQTSDSLPVLQAVFHDNKNFDQAVNACLQGRNSLNKPAGLKADSDPGQPSWVPEAAKILDIPYFDLDLTESREAVLDALGNQKIRVKYTEKADARSSRRLDYEESQKLGALPVKDLEDGTVLTAFCDPLYEDQMRAVSDIIKMPVTPCLAERKQLLDASQRILGKVNLGTMALKEGLITRSQLNSALALASSTHMRLGKALVYSGYLTEDQLFSFLSRQSKIPFFDLTGIKLDPQAAQLLSADEERQNGVLPLVKNSTGTVVTAVTDPLNEEVTSFLDQKLGGQVERVLVTESDLEKAFESLYSKTYVEKSVSDLLDRSPEDSAYHVLSKPQIIFFILLAIGLIVWGIFSWRSMAITLNLLFTVFYLSFSFYKVLLIANSINHNLEVPVTKEDVAALKDENLPVYTILIPVYKEAKVLPALLESIAKIDYPHIKLDVKVLMEEDDTETINTFYRINPPSFIEGLVLPYAEPKTKPKACNYGLIHAKGAYVVIFDAEDRPDADQLKKVVVAFSKVPDNVACIQTKLNYYNRHQNILTHWFTSEYSMWFDLLLPGLDSREDPIPLGGTSNHFKTAALMEAGAWDPYNVTEDADLGMRMYKRKMRTRIVDSSTYEEANSEIYNWIRQRSRWIKGYIQTWLVHMRHPIKLIKDIGLKGFFSFQMIIGGTFFADLMNPLYWVLTTLWFF